MDTKAAQENPELERLKQEKAKVETERDIQKAEAEILRSIFPKGETKGLEGKITIGDNLLFPGTVLAYASASEIAKRLAQDILSGGEAPETIIVYSEKDFGSIAAYQSVLYKIDMVKQGYDSALEKKARVEAVAPTAALLAPELATMTLKSVADLVAFFKTNVEIKGLSVTVEEVAVIADLAQALMNPKSQPGSPGKDLRKIKVIYTPAYLPAHFLSDPIKDSELAQKLGALYSSRNKAGKVIAAFEAKSDDEKKKDSDKDDIPVLKILNAEADKLSSYLGTIDDKTGLNPLTMFLKAESLKKELAKDKRAVLLTKIHVGAGSNKTTQRLFKKSKLEHSGGAVITFLLFEPQGAIRFSKTYFCATQYTEFEKIEDLKYLKNFGN